MNFPLKYISLDTANGLSLQIAARSIGIRERKYANAIASNRITKQEVEMLRERLRAANVKAVPEFTQKRFKTNYPQVEVHYFTE